MIISESYWLKEAKAALRSRDPVDAANDADHREQVLAGTISVMRPMVFA